MTNDRDTGRITAMVKDFLTERFDVPAENMTDDASMRDLGLDSIIMLDVMLEMEDRLGVKLRDLAMPANPKLHDIVALIERNLAASK